VRVKTISVKDAVSLIPDGTLMIGGFIGVGTSERLEGSTLAAIQNRRRERHGV
jgi:acyl CoA:acetate/3-ketoacid CoA transferase alpha subunit